MFVLGELLLGSFAAFDGKLCQKLIDISIGVSFFEVRVTLRQVKIFNGVFIVLGVRVIKNENMVVVHLIKGKLKCSLIIFKR